MTHRGAEPTIKKKRKFVNKHEVLLLMKKAEAIGRAFESNKERALHFRYWDRFCEVMEIDSQAFGKPDSEGGKVTPDQLKKETDVLAALAGFVVHNPKIPKGPRITRDGTGDTQMDDDDDDEDDDDIDNLQCKALTYPGAMVSNNAGENVAGSKSHFERRGYNSVDFAMKVINSVRQLYLKRYGRQPGIVNERMPNNAYSKFGRVLNGLRKMSTMKDRPIQPILHHHMLGIRAQLNLQNSQMDRALWALWTTMWHGVLGFSNVLRRKCDDENTPWNPAIDLHRGRVVIEPIPRHDFRTGSVITDKHGHELENVRIVLRLEPSRLGRANDIAVDSATGCILRSFVVDRDPNYRDPNNVSAGNAIWNMLDKEPSNIMTSSNGQAVLMQNIPLFRDPRNGREIPRDFAIARLKKCLAKAGYPELACGPHSLGMGGATLMAGSKQGWRMISTCMNTWHTDPGFTLERLEAASAEISRGLVNVVPPSRGVASRYPAARTARAEPSNASNGS